MQSGFKLAEKGTSREHTESQTGNKCLRIQDACLQSAYSLRLISCYGEICRIFLIELFKDPVPVSQAKY